MSYSLQETVGPPNKNMKVCTYKTGVRLLLLLFCLLLIVPRRLAFMTMIDRIVKLQSGIPHAFHRANPDYLQTRTAEMTYGTITAAPSTASRFTASNASLA